MGRIHRAGSGPVVILSNVQHSPGNVPGVILEDTVTLTSRKTALAGLAALGVSALVLAGCAAAPSGTATTKAAKNYLPCMVSDTGGFDDHSFNQIGLDGLQAAAKDLGVKEKHVQSEQPRTTYAPNIESPLSAGAT